MSLSQPQTKRHSQSACQKKDRPSVKVSAAGNAMIDVSQIISVLKCPNITSLGGIHSCQWVSDKRRTLWSDDNAMSPAD